MKKTSHSVGEARGGEARRGEAGEDNHLVVVSYVSYFYFSCHHNCRECRWIVLALARIPVPPAPAEGRSINLTATTTTADNIYATKTRSLSPPSFARAQEVVGAGAQD